MAITDINPNSGSIINNGSLISVSNSVPLAISTITLVREGWDNELVYSAGAFQPGYTGTRTVSGSVETFTIRKDLAGWVESPFQLIFDDGTTETTINYLLMEPGEYPPLMGPGGTGGGGAPFAQYLDDLLDVDAASPSDTEVLGWDSGLARWTPRAPTTPGAHVLDSHTDVTITGPQNDEVLTYQGGVWVNQAAQGGGTVASAPLVSYDVVANDSTPAAGFVGVISTGGFANVTALHFADEDIEGITVAPFWAEVEAGNIITLRKEDDYTIAGQFVVTAPTQDNDRTTFNVTSVLSASGDPATGHRMNVYVTGVGATLDRVITHTPDNDVTVPSSAPIILRDGGVAFTPLSITTTSTDINAHPLQIGAFTNNAIRITQDAVAGHLLIGRNDIQATSTTAGFDITMSGSSDPVQGDLGIHGGDSSASSGKAGNVRINGGYSAGAAAGGDVRIEAGTGGTPGEIRFSQGISIVQSADHPFPTPTTSRGQYWVRSSDGKPMFTTSAGTDYDLTAGGTGGNVNFTSGSVVDNQIVRYDANGNQIQGGTSVPTIDDGGNITSSVGIQCNGFQATGDAQIDGELAVSTVFNVDATGIQVLSGNISVAGTVDGVDVAQLKSDFDTHDGGTAGHPNFSTSAATPGFAPGSSGQTTYFLRGDGQWAPGGLGSTTFIDLTDTDPTTYVGQAGKVVQVNTGATGLEFGSVLSNPTFTSIGETPNSMAGHAYHGLRVNGGLTSLEYVDNWIYQTAPPSTEYGLNGSIYIDTINEQVYMQTSEGVGRWTLLNDGGEATPRLRAQATAVDSINANVLITGAGITPNLDATLLDYTGLTFEDDVEIYINGKLMRGGPTSGANFDVYPSTDPAEISAGAFYCEFALTSGDVIQMFYGGGATFGGIHTIDDLNSAIVDATFGGLAVGDFPQIVSTVNGPGLPVLDGSNLTDIAATVPSEAGPGVFVYDANGDPDFLDSNTPAVDLPLLSNDTAVPQFAALPPSSVDSTGGSSGQVLSWGTPPVWAAASTTAVALNTTGGDVDINNAGAPATGDVLVATSSSTAVWANTFYPIGIRKSGGVVAVSQTAPTAGQVLQASDASNAAWTTPSNKLTFWQNFSYTAAASTFAYYAPAQDMYSSVWATNASVAPADQVQGPIVPTGYTKLDVTVWIRAITGAANFEAKSVRIYKRAITNQAAQGANTAISGNPFSGNNNSVQDAWFVITPAQQTVAAGDMILVGVENDASTTGSHLSYGQIRIELSP